MSAEASQDEGEEANESGLVIIPDVTDHKDVTSVTPDIIALKIGHITVLTFSVASNLGLDAIPSKPKKMRELKFQKPVESETSRSLRKLIWCLTNGQKEQ